MPEQNITTGRKSRLLTHHYTAARALRWMYTGRKDWPRRMSVGRALIRLLREANVERGRMDAGDAYLAAIRALIAATGSDESANAERVQRLMVKFRRWATHEQEPQQRSHEQEKPLASILATTQTFNSAGDFPVIGALKGDKVEVKEVSLNDLKPGDAVLVLDTEENKFAGIGRFKCIEDGKEIDGEPCNVFWIIENTEVRWFKRSFTGWKIYRVSAIVRRTPVEMADTKEAERAACLARLRQRLRRLGDDITDSTERFKIEREIYDLERAEASAGTDEWAGFDLVNG